METVICGLCIILCDFTRGNLGFDNLFHDQGISDKTRVILKHYHSL